MNQNRFITRTEKIPFYNDYDIVVAGGGVAGIAAALSAGRFGKKVLLIEKTCMLGGLATIGLINFFVPMCNGRGKQIIFGMPEEFLRIATRYGYDTMPQEWKNGEPKEPTNVRYITRYSPWLFALAMTDILVETGVQILFDTIVGDVEMEGNLCKGLLIENKSGRSFCTASVYIDATGDADILYRAGVPTIQGKNYFTYLAHGATIDSCKKVVESGDIGKLRVSFTGGSANLYGGDHPEEMPFFTGTSGDDVADFLIKNQRLLFQKLKNDSKNSRDIITPPAMAQFRTTRRINGNYTLLESDSYRHFEDSVGAICDFDRRDFLYEIPFGTLIHSAFPNIITAGRCAAGDGYAWDVLRVIPPAIISGQAAGTAAVLALDSRTSVTKVDIKRLQGMLESCGNSIHFDDRYVPANKEAATDAIADIGHI